MVESNSWCVMIGEMGGSGLEGSRGKDVEDVVCRMGKNLISKV